MRPQKLFAGDAITASWLQKLFDWIETEIKPVGDNKTIAVNGNVISALGKTQEIIAAPKYFWQLEIAEETTTETDETTGEITETTKYFLQIIDANNCLAKAFGETKKFSLDYKKEITKESDNQKSVFLRWNGEIEIITEASSYTSNALHPIQKLGRIHWIGEEKPKFIQEFFTTNNTIVLNDNANILHVLAKPVLNGNIEILEMQTDLNNGRKITKTIVAELDALNKKLYAHYSIAGTVDFVLNSDVKISDSSNLYLFLGVIGQDLAYNDNAARFTERWYIDELA